MTGVAIEAGGWRGSASAGSRQSALALGPAGQVILPAAITKIGAQVDGGGLCRRYGVRFTGKTLFLAADIEAGAHGVDLAACGEAGKAAWLGDCIGSSASARNQ